jgi:peptidoglycan-associated lipoprotein
MKNLSLFGVFIVTTALLASGCHRKPTSLTPIPGMEHQQGQNEGVGSGTAMPGEGGVTSTPANHGEGIAMSANGKFADLLNGPHNEDREKFEGNCDERGTEKYNLALGERRALSVREYLANLGMDPQRIKTVSYGFSKPVETGHNEAAWKQNRRADLVLVTPK